MKTYEFRYLVNAIVIAVIIVIGLLIAFAYGAVWINKGFRQDEKFADVYREMAIQRNEIFEDHAKEDALLINEVLAEKLDKKFKEIQPSCFKGGSTH